MTRQEAYKILEIDQTTNTEEIKKAYKSKAKKYHPDLYQGDKTFAEEKMKELNEAYAILSTPINSNTFSSNFYYDSQTYKFGEEFQRMRYEYMRAEKARQEQEEFWNKMQEDLERMQKEIEESYRKIKKMFKRLLIFLFCTLEFYIVLLVVNTIKSIIFYFNEELWFFFVYFIILGIMALAGVVLAPIGFRWLLKRAGIIK